MTRLKATTIRAGRGYRLLTLTIEGLVLRKINDLQRHNYIEIVIFIIK
jgi:hypothetical protein